MNEWFCLFFLRQITKGVLHETRPCKKQVVYDTWGIVTCFCIVFAYDTQKKGKTTFQLHKKEDSMLMNFFCLEYKQKVKRILF